MPQIEDVPKVSVLKMLHCSIIHGIVVAKEGRTIQDTEGNEKRLCDHCSSFDVLLTSEKASLLQEEKGRQVAR